MATLLPCWSSPHRPTWAARSGLATGTPWAPWAPTLEPIGYKQVSDPLRIVWSRLDRHMEEPSVLGLMLPGILSDCQRDVA